MQNEMCQLPARRGKADMKRLRKRPAPKPTEATRRIERAVELQEQLKRAVDEVAKWPAHRRAELEQWARESSNDPPRGGERQGPG